MNTEPTTSSTNMCINCTDDLVRQAEIRTISREELKGWDPLVIMTAVDFVTGAAFRIGPAVDTIEDALELLESGELLRLAKERERKEKELLRHASLEW